ncbi:hypothetical protein EJ02DRAFT_449612 [Clathrospora elynae]|uniref:Uncharacterized protein n=1 Tax=Clathrospora elynae TaxID=706981 RepID=A0A6A5TEX2_9PLEO|nr:hypothetical protein EJ02DRAFT_449612 [Clathrospora elynae]
MHIYPLLALLAPAAVRAAGCYSETGPGWGSFRQLANNDADAVCGSSEVSGNFNGNTKYACRYLGNNIKAEFWVTGTGYLSAQDCAFGLKEEINGCGWGGENFHGDFYYRSDANAGGC